MEARKSNSTSAGLPYVNNIGSILFTIAVNTACILLFCWNRRTVLLSVIISTIACGVVASIMDTLIAAKIVRKMRDAGTLPAAVPESKLMMRLPRNPWLLSLLFAAIFSALALLLNLALIRFLRYRPSRFCAWWCGRRRFPACFRPS